MRNLIAAEMMGRLARMWALGVAISITQTLAIGAELAHGQEIAATVRGDPAGREEERKRLFMSLRQAGTETEGLARALDIWLFWLEAPDAETASMMNQALERRRRYDLAGALMILDELVERTPQWAEAWNQRATVLFEMGRDDRSLADVERVLTLEPKHFGAMAGQAIILMRQGRMRAAQSILRRAVEIHPFLAERAMIVPGPGEVEPRPGERRL